MKNIFFLTCISLNLCYSQSKIESTSKRISINSSRFSDIEFCSYKNIKEISVNAKIKSINFPNCIKEFDSLNVILCQRTMIENIDLLYGLKALEILYIKTTHYNIFFTEIPELEVLDLTLTKHSVKDTIKFKIHNSNNLNYLSINTNNELKFDSSINFLTNIASLNVPFNLFNGVFKFDALTFKFLTKISIENTDFTKTNIKPENVIKFVKINLFFANCKFTSQQIEMFKSIFKNEIVFYNCKIDGHRKKIFKLNEKSKNR